MVKLPNDERLVLVALGESGSGKSNLLNLILSTPGEQNVVFPEGEGAEPCTLQPQEESGCWRGDPGRQVTLFDTPGLCSADPGLYSANNPSCTDRDILQTVLHLVKDLSYINCFLIVVKSGTSRFLSQHQRMFEHLEEVFGSRLWKNAIIDVSWETNAREKRNFERWIEKLEEKFPAAKNVKQVYLNTPDHELDTLEDLWQMISLPCKYTFPSNNPSILVDSDNSSGRSSRNQGRESPDVSTSSNISSNLSQSLSDLRASRCSLSGSRTLLSSNRTNLSTDHLLDIPYTMPPLPPRSPTRRRSYQPPRSVSTTPRLPRSFMPSSFSTTEDYSSSRFSSSRYKRKSFRDTSPLSSWSTRPSRETSPSSTSFGYKTVETSPSSTSFGYKTVSIPTYLRTCSAYKVPYTKAMREGRLEKSYASEDRILLEKADDIPYPELESLDAIPRIPFGLDLMYLAYEAIQLPPMLQDIQEFDSMSYSRGCLSIETFSFISVAGELQTLLEVEASSALVVSSPETATARRSSYKQENKLNTPEALVTKNPYNYVKRALLPRLKYHWDQGFRQGNHGWEKTPVIKIKLKYNEEDKDLLPTFISIEGGRWCETKRIKMEGHKAKAKLRATEGPEFCIRLVPLDTEHRPEASVPEFLVTIEPTPTTNSNNSNNNSNNNNNNKKGEKEKEKEKEKWVKAAVKPSLPE